jgi:hypothetical protein
MKGAPGKNALDLIEEATHLLRVAPAGAWFSYYLGSLPFALGFLYFWSDMSRSAFAAQRLSGAALGMALLFVWMKLWQSIFAQRLLRQLVGEPALRSSLGRLGRTALAQAIVQPSGSFLLPVAFVLTVPFGWFYAFYQNVTVLGGGENRSMRELVRKAWRLALLWPGQNHHLLLFTSLFGFFVFLNLVSALVAGPYLLDRFLGVQTVFTKSSWAILNTTFFAAVGALTYLCLDPLLKACYVLRCFYGESLQTGTDLKAELAAFASAPRKAAAALAIVATLMLRAAPNVQAAPARGNPQSANGNPPSAVSPSALDGAIEEVINQREYLWRLPREKGPSNNGEKGILAGLLQGIVESLESAAKAVVRWITRVVQWFRQLTWPRLSGRGTPGDWTSPIYALIVLLTATLLGVLAWTLWRMWRRERSEAAQVIGAQPMAGPPNLADEHVAADQLPEDGWILLGRELIERGELRLALRAFYLASLAHLAERGLIALARFKTNCDYERELERRAHALPEVLGPFRQNVLEFDRVWYGFHDVSRETLDQFAHNVERIKVG